MGNEYFFVLKQDGKEVGQVEMTVKGGKLHFEIQNGWDTQEVQTCDIPAGLFRKESKRGRIRHHQAADGRNKTSNSQSPKQPESR